MPALKPGCVYLASQFASCKQCCWQLIAMMACIDIDLDLARSIDLYVRVYALTKFGHLNERSRNWSTLG